MSANQLVEAIRRGETRPAGAHGGPITLAHSLLKLMHDGNSQRGRAAGARGVPLGGPVQSLLRIVFDADARDLRERLRFQAKAWVHRWVRGVSGRERDASFEATLESEVYALLAEPGLLGRLSSTTATDDRIFLVVGTLVNRVFARYMANLRARPARA